MEESCSYSTANKIGDFYPIGDYKTAEPVWHRPDRITLLISHQSDIPDCKGTLAYLNSFGSYVFAEVNDSHPVNERERRVYLDVLHEDDERIPDESAYPATAEEVESFWQRAKTILA